MKLNEYKNNEDYLVLNHDERKEAIAETIKESLCYFRAGFIAQFTPLNKRSLTILQENDDGYLNDEFIKLVGDNLDELTDKAINADGYGHFLSPYDGEEIEITENNETFYVYRQN